MASTLNVKADAGTLLAADNLRSIATQGLGTVYCFRFIFLTVNGGATK